MSSGRAPAARSRSRIGVSSWWNRGHQGRSLWLPAQQSRRIVCRGVRISQGEREAHAAFYATLGGTPIWEDYLPDADTP